MRDIHHYERGLNWSHHVVNLRSELAFDRMGVHWCLWHSQFAHLRDTVTADNRLEIRNVWQGLFGWQGTVKTILYGK